MKRSGREARWADIPSARTRFTAEAAFLILVAGGAALARLSPLSIIVLMLVAWLLVALIERASSREQASALAGAQDARTDETEVLPVPEPEPAEEVVEAPAPAAQPKHRVAFRWLFWRRERTGVVALPEPTASLEDRPSRSHVTRIEAESPPPAIEVETIVTEIPAPGPAVTKRPLDLPGLEEPETARAAAPPPPEASVVEPPVEPPRVEPPPLVEPPRVERAPEPPPVERAPPPPPQPPPAPPVPRPPAREWNIWDLEKQARQQAGDPLRDEQWTALFMNLRQYANADGVLPKEFDELVRESFSELIQAA